MSAVAGLGKTVKRFTAIGLGGRPVRFGAGWLSCCVSDNKGTEKRGNETKIETWNHVTRIN